MVFFCLGRSYNSFPQAGNCNAGKGSFGVVTCRFSKRLHKWLELLNAIDVYLNLDATEFFVDILFECVEMITIWLFNIAMENSHF